MAASVQAGFNRLAPYYDRLAQLVFGKSIHRIQVQLIKAIPPGGSVLLIGGGTGQILEDIAQLTPSAEVYFLDISEKMIAKARKRETGRLQIQFHCDKVEDLPTECEFDCVFTPFFLDLFEGEKLKSIFSKLSNHLRPNGIWLYADFQVSNGWMKPVSQVLIWLMYRFFNFFAGIEAKKLEDVAHLFKQNNYRLLEENQLFGGMITGKQYKQN